MRRREITKRVHACVRDCKVMTMSDNKIIALFTSKENTRKYLFLFFSTGGHNQVVGKKSSSFRYISDDLICHFRRL